MNEEKGVYRFSDATAIILAGGKSSRMGGKDKSMLGIKGQPMIQYIAKQLSGMFGEVIIGATDIAKYAFLGLKVVPDCQTGMGPLAGLCSCLAASSHDLNFVTACDIPEMNGEYISRLFDAASGADIVMPVSPGGRYEPLFALYRRNVQLKAGELLAEGKRRISDLTDRVNTIYIRFDSGEWYHNLNSPDDFLQYISKR